MFNKCSAAAPPATALNRPVTKQSDGRPLTGLIRPGSSLNSRKGLVSGGMVTAKTARLKTAGWQQRPATASIMNMMNSQAGDLLNSLQALDQSAMDRMADNHQIAKVLFWHFYQTDQIPTRALELCQKIMDDAKR